MNSAATNDRMLQDRAIREATSDLEVARNTLVSAEAGRIPGFGPTQIAGLAAIVDERTTILSDLKAQAADRRIANYVAMHGKKPSAAMLKRLGA